MFYIRRLFHQDITHQITANKEGSLFFFEFNTAQADVADRKICFTFQSQDELNGTTFNAVLHRDSDVESRLNGEFKSFLMNRAGAVEGDILLITKISSDSYTLALVPQTSPNYKVFASLLNMVGKKVNHLVTVEDAAFDFSSLAFQSIFFGAPGTGKSHEIKKQTVGQSVERTTFHPDSDYSTFVGSYKPTTKEIPITTPIGKTATPVVDENGNPVFETKIVYEFVEQAFLKAYVNAWKLLAEGKPQFLIVEEINRGNCAQIFGDLFQLLDRNEYGFSDYPVTADSDLEKHLVKALESVTIDAETIKGEYECSNAEIASLVKLGKRLLLPSNLYIWATMNTSDQSLFPIDSAFKRRWDWKYIPIDTKKENWSIKVNNSSYSWSDFLEKINEKIGSTTSSEDKKLGFYFCKANHNEISADRFVSKVLFYIYNDVFKDYGFEDPIFKNNGEVMSFQSFYNTDGSINEVLVNIILDNLKVELISEVDETEEEFKKMDVSKFNEVIFSDGIVVKGKTQFDTYQGALEKIGIENVANVVSEKGWRRKTSLVVDSKQHDDIINSKEFSYVQIGDYYVVKGINAKSMMGYLKGINEKLNLGLTIQ